LAETHRFVRDVIGDDADLMIDVNRGWSLQTAIEGARALEDLNIRWLEELLDGPTIIGSWNFSPNPLRRVCGPREIFAAAPARTRGQWKFKCTKPLINCNSGENSNTSHISSHLLRSALLSTAASPKS
jgi:Enolase C-terminal domain-like